MTDPDQHLADAFRRFAASGSPDALAEVYDRTAPSLLRLAIHLAPDVAQAEDLVQATFVTAIEKARSFDPSRPIRPWLNGILSGHANNLRRKVNRRRTEGSGELTHEFLADSEATDPLDAAALEEFDAEIDRAIDELPEAYRPVLVLRLRHGMIAADIAHALRRPPGTVRTQLVRGLERLRKALPAGVAAVLAGFVTPTRGLAAIRTDLLRSLPPPTPTEPSTSAPIATTGATLIMKKWIAAAAVLLLSLATWQVFDGPDSTPTRPSPSADRRTGEVNDPNESSQTERFAAASEGTEEIDSALPRWNLSGRIEVSPGISFDGATVIAYRGAPGDQPLKLSSVMNAVNMPGVAEQTFAALRVDGQPLATAPLDGTGSFRFEDLRHPDLRLRLEHRFYAFRETVPAHRTNRTDADLGVLPTICGGQIVGRLTRDISCEVAIIAEADAMEPVRDLPSFLARTASGGQKSERNDPGRGFRFDAVPPSASVHLMALDAGRATTPAFPIGPGDVVEVLLRPVPTANLEVLVLGPAGAPIEGAKVAARGETTGGVLTRQLGRLEQETDREGRVLLTPLDALNRTHYEVAKRGFVGATGTVALSASKRNAIEVRLSRGKLVEGLVVDAEGQPIVDAGVALMPEIDIPMVGSARSFLGNGAFGSVAEKSGDRTDENGRFSLSGIADDAEPGSHAVIAWAPGFSANSAAIAEGGITRIVLLPPARVIGRITNDSDGHVEVRAITKMMGVLDRTVAMEDVRLAESKAFELALDPGSTTLSIRGAGFAEWRKRIRAEAGTTIDLGEIELVAGAVIRGRVLDHEGLPVPDATVSRRKGGMADHPMLALFSDDSRTTTDDDGHFELGGLPAGRVVLIANAENLPSARSDRLQLGEGEVLDNVLLQLQAPGRIEGRLLLPPGADASDWQVLAETTTKMATRATQLAFDGSFSFDGLDAGSWNVSAMDVSSIAAANQDMIDGVATGRGIDTSSLIRGIQDKTVMARTEVNPAETSSVELDARFLSGTEGVQVVIRIRDGDSDLENGLVEFTQTDDTGTPILIFAFVDRGYAQLDRAHPGPATIQIRAGAALAPVGTATPIMIAEGPISEHRIDLPGGAIAGLVRDDAGEPLPGALISLRTEDREPSIMASDAEGRFEFRSLARGRYEVQVLSDLLRSNDTLSARKTVEITEGTEAIELRAERGGELQVVVQGPDGRALSGARVLVVDRNGTPIGPNGARRTDPSGVAHVSGLASGTIHLVVSRDGLATTVTSALETRRGSLQTERVTLDHGARCTLQIVDENEQPVELSSRGATRLRIGLGDGPPIDAFLLGAERAGTGTLSLGTLPTGRARFELRRNGETAAVERTVPRGRSSRLVLRF